METQNDKPMFKQIAMLLIQADKCVKEGNLSAALDKIAEARKHDPAHLYAIAYEERVKALLHNQQKTGGPGAMKKENEKNGRAACSSNGHLHEVQVLKETPIPQQTPPVASPPPKNTASAIGEKESNGAASVEETVAQNRETKIAEMLSQAYHFFLRKEYNRALDEIARIYLLAPSHGRARSLEATIRATIRVQNHEQSIQHNHMPTGNNAAKTSDRPATDDLRRAAIEQKVNEFIDRISTLAEKQQYKRALDELTRGYILDPYHPRLRLLEEKIRSEEQKFTCQQQTAASVAVGSAQVNGSGNRHDRSATVMQCFIRVNDLLRRNKLEDALNELALAVVIDPFNEEVIKMERTIIEAQHRQLEERRKTCKEIAAMIAA